MCSSPNCHQHQHRGLFRTPASSRHFILSLDIVFRATLSSPLFYCHLSRKQSRQCLSLQKARPRLGLHLKDSPQPCTALPHSLSGGIRNFNIEENMLTGNYNLSWFISLISNSPFPGVPLSHTGDGETPRRRSVLASHSGTHQSIASTVLWEGM